MAIYQETLPEDTWMRVCEIIRCLMEAWWEKREAFVQPQKFLNGDDIQKYFGVNKGPMIGKVLDAVREAQACGDILDKDAAAVFVSNWLKLYREDADEEVDNDRE
jgi:hypothetical protein